MMRRIRNQRGAALLETAITLPLILLVSVAILEFGRAFQTWQVLTNAAREGARLSIIAGNSDEQVITAVQNYLRDGQLSAADDASVTVERNVAFNATATASRVSVAYPFTFVVLDPVMRLVRAGENNAANRTMMGTSALMRNE